MKQWIALTVVAALILVVSRLLDTSPWLWGTAKQIASTGFVLTALSAGALRSRYGKLLFSGLVLSWWGDAFLIGSGDTFFQLGLVSFLLGHVMYCVAFAAHGVRVRGIAIAIAVVLPSAVGVLWWLMPSVSADLKIPVIAYIVVISTMVILAGGTFAKGAPKVILVGAVLFYMSDISVARGQFAPSAFPDYVWGLPFYYGGQILLAYSASQVGGGGTADPADF